MAVAQVKAEKAQVKAEKVGGREGRRRSLARPVDEVASCTGASLWLRGKFGASACAIAVEPMADGISRQPECPADLTE